MKEMRRLFKNIHGESIDEIKHTLDVLKANPGTKVYVGTDSQKKRKSIEYAVVIAYRYGHRGCHFIYSKWNVSRKGYGRGDDLIIKRLTEEIQTSIEVAERLKEGSISVYQIDLDLNGNPKWKSNKLVQMGVGWARGLGYNVAIKPEELVAVKAANQLVNK
ncbi:MAG: hypothetical protein J5I47_13560 [Vicingus serpentipes]|nr:hypothetical protein [Vicingus serpentipes]